jgi:hypothetical protein
VRKFDTKEKSVVYRKRYSRYNCKVIANLPRDIAMLLQVIVNLSYRRMKYPREGMVFLTIVKLSQL